MSSLQVTDLRKIVDQKTGEDLEAKQKTERDQQPREAVGGE